MKEKISLLRSVIAEIFCPICWIGPLVVVALVLSGTKELPALVKFRPLFITIAILLLVWAWWVVIKKGRCCQVEGKHTKFLKKNKILLSVITAIVILLIFLLYLPGTI
ncbi:MAG: mercuric transporter MerT family protein [bacterium]